MNFVEILFISISLAMDAFAVSLCKGFSFGKVVKRYVLLIAGYFSFFQGLMPLLGYYLGSYFKDMFFVVDHFIAFFLLGIIGLDMISEGIRSTQVVDENVDIKTMLILSLATSIDAFVSGVTFSMFDVNIFSSILLILLITFIMCMGGVILGSKVSSKVGNKAKIFGGLLLIVMGSKILIEHLFFI